MQSVFANLHLSVYPNIFSFRIFVAGGGASVAVFAVLALVVVYATKLMTGVFFRYHQHQKDLKIRNHGPVAVSFWGFWFDWLQKSIVFGDICGSFCVFFFDFMFNLKMTNFLRLIFFYIKFTINFKIAFAIELRAFWRVVIGLIWLIHIGRRSFEVVMVDCVRASNQGMEARTYTTEK